MISEKVLEPAVQLFGAKSAVPCNGSRAAVRLGVASSYLKVSPPSGLCVTRVVFELPLFCVHRAGPSIAYLLTGQLFYQPVR